MTTETVVLQDARLDPDRFILDGIDVSEEPHFTVSEVAKVFFGKSSHWIRWLETKGPDKSSAFVLDGHPVGTSRTEKGARYYTLADVEKMTHALAQGGHINGAQAANSLHVVRSLARIWGYVS